MIAHLIHYYYDGFFLTWSIQLPFRLHKDDQVHNELLDNLGSIKISKEELDKWYDYSINHEYFIVRHVQIDHRGNVVAWIEKEKS